MSPRERSKRSERALALAQALQRWTEADREFRAAVAERLRVGASELEALMLLIEDESPWTAGKIAEALGLTTGAVTGLVDRLEKGGWVQRVRHGADRRQVWIERSPSRRAELETEMALRRAALAEAVDGVDEETLEEAVSVIDRAVQHLSAESARLAPRVAEAAAGAAEGPTSAPIGDATRGTLRIVGGVAKLELRGARIKDLFRATWQGRPPVVRVDPGGVVQLKYRGFGLFGWLGAGAEIALATAVPWVIEIRGGASEVEANLAEVTLERIEIVGGASEVDLRLPAPKGTVPVRITGGASEVKLRRPRGSAVQVAVTGGASEVVLDRKHAAHGDGVVRLATEGYEGATDRYSIEIVGGASEVVVTGE